MMNILNISMKVCNEVPQQRKNEPGQVKRGTETWMRQVLKVKNGSSEIVTLS